MNSPVELQDPINNSLIHPDYMIRRDPEDILRRAINRTRQARNAKRVVDREFRKLPLAQQRRIIKLKHRGFTAEDLADHDFNFTIGNSSDYSELPVGDSTSWNTDTYPETSTEWESIDLNSQAPSSYYAAGERPRWNLSRIASGTDEAFATDEVAGVSTAESAGAVSGVAELAPILAAKGYLYSKDPSYGSQGNYAQGWATYARRNRQVYQAPPQAGGYPNDWASHNHGNTQG